MDINAWYGKAIAWAADKGLVSGYGGGLFGPDDPITREQMAVLLNNYIKYKEYSLTVVTEKKTFNDDTMISSWAKEAVENLQMVGIISGKPGDLFDPKSVATRAEVAAIFTKFLEAAGIVLPLPQTANTGGTASVSSIFAKLPGKESEIVPVNRSSGDSETLYCICITIY